jgi:hypothetical protein
VFVSEDDPVRSVRTGPFGPVFTLATG